VTKFCNKCQQEKDISEFYTTKDGKPLARCKECRKKEAKERMGSDPEKYRQHRREYYHANKERINEQRRGPSKLWRRKDRLENPDKHLENWLSSRYNMSLEDYQNRLEKQKYKCDCCGRPFSEFKKPPCVDHDHSCCPGASCGKCVRGILCHTCNVSLGFLETGKHQHLMAYLIGREEENNV
jgi:Recombination endonuclease VII